MCWYPRWRLLKKILGGGAPVDLPAGNEVVLVDWTQVDATRAIKVVAEIDASGNGGGQIDGIAIEAVSFPGQGVFRDAQALQTPLTTGLAVAIESTCPYPSSVRVLATSQAGSIYGRGRAVVFLSG